MHHVFTPRRFLFLIAPITLFYVLYMIAPIFMAGYYSLTNYRGVGIPQWNQFANYARLLKDRFVLKSITNTLKTTVTTLMISLPVSFFIAYCVNEKSRRNEIYKAVFFAPYVIPGIISGLIWLFILDPTVGLLNSFLRVMGLGSLTQQWIGGKVLTPYSIAIVSTWGGLGFNMAVWLMGMKGIPAEVLESSQIDGATKPQQIRYILLPMLKETFKSLFIFSVTGSLKIFDTVYQLTGGGPNHLSETIVSYMYSITFHSKLYGYGMAIAVLEFVLAVSMTILFLTISNKRIEQ